MALALLTQNVPFKGMNTVSPEREMPEGFAPLIQNAWFEDGVTLKRRPGQTLANPGELSTGQAIDHMFEHVTPAGVSTIFCHTADGKIGHYSGGWTVDDTSFTSRTRAATLAGTSVFGDGLTAAKKFDGSTWSAVTTTPTPVGSSYIGNIFHTHRGRMYAAGDPSRRMTVYYSDTYLGQGADYWSQTVGTSGEQGGFIDCSEDVSVTDEIVGLTTHQDFLVVLCKHHILFYTCDDPNTSVTLHKKITGEGCVIQDSIHGVGEDTLFLSPTGFKSLSLSLIQGDTVVNNISDPIHGTIKALLRDTSVNQADIRATYSATLGLYICTIGSYQYAYQPQFKAWFEWTGILNQVFTDSAGQMYSADSYVHNVDITSYADVIDGGSTTSITMTWTLAPFHTEAGHHPRWNYMDLSYQTAVANDSLTLKTWMDFDTNYIITNTIALTPSVAMSSGLYEDDIRIPLLGRGEFMSAQLINGSQNDFRFVLAEAYFNDGGMRK